jgi:putative ABC transport system permease protein
MIRDLFHDLRQAIRSLRRQPGFVVTAVTILALGLGAATAMFSMLDALLLRPLPFAESERLVRIHRTMAADSADSVDRMHTPGGYFAYRAEGGVFEGVAAIAMSDTSVDLDPGQPPEMMWGARVSPDYFPVFRVQPRLGRLFVPEEYQAGRGGVVLLSSQLWESRFASDPGIVGRTVRLDGQPFTVIGVMPPELHDPIRFWSRGLLWRPLDFGAAAQNDHEHHWLRLIARLKPGVSWATAQAAASAVAARLEVDHRTGSGARLMAPQATGALDVAGARVVWLSMGLAVFVLLIASVNMAGLQLARLATRGHDLAVRVALGAGRGRLVRELLTENLLLCAVGGGLGLLVAEWCTGLLASRMSIGWRRATVGVPAQLDARVVGFALLLMVLTALVAGTVPAWLSASRAVAQTLRAGGRGASEGSSSWSRLRQGLVVTEMALALVLLAAGGLFVRGLHGFVARDPGWTVDHLLTALVNLPGPRHRGEPGAAFLDRLQQRLTTLPGVQSAAVADGLPLWENGQPVRSLWVLGTPAPRPGEGPTTFSYAVTPSYFRTVGLALREGRLFIDADRRSQEAVAIVSESMARQLWPGGSALGKRLGTPASDPARPDHWQTVIGVVSDARFAATLSTPSTPFQLYEPLEAPGDAMLVLRTRGLPESLTADLRRSVAELDSEVSLFEIHGARVLADRTLGNVALIAWVLFGFAALGLLLSALGVYGLFSGYVVQRTREIGVRMALGAQSRQVLGFVLGKGLRLALAGGALGVAAALAVVPVLTSVASELPAQGPVAVIALALALIVVALFACWLPARRAAAMDPMVALRRE